jgi:hypothetical protein
MRGESFVKSGEVGEGGRCDAEAAAGVRSSGHIRQRVEGTYRWRRGLDSGKENDAEPVPVSLLLLLHPSLPLPLLELHYIYQYQWNRCRRRNSPANVSNLCKSLIVNSSNLSLGASHLSLSLFVLFTPSPSPMPTPSSVLGLYSPLNIDFLRSIRPVPCDETRRARLSGRVCSRMKALNS